MIPLLVKKDLVGGTADDLDAIDPNDIYGDSTNIKLVTNAICITVDSANAITYIHKANNLGNNKSTDSPIIILPIATPSNWSWELISKLGVTPDELPSGIVKELSSHIVPAGYAKINQSDPMPEFIDGSDWVGQANNPFLGFYGDWIYFIGEEWMTVAQNWKLNYKTGAFATSPPNNVTMSSPAKTQVGDAAYFFDHSSGANYKKFDMSTESWSDIAALPGVTRSSTVGGNLNGKIYIAGGYSTQYEDLFYEYDPVLDQYAQKADLPNVAISALCPFGTKLYGITDETPSKIYAYDPVGNSWSSALADCNFQLNGFLGYGWLKEWGVWAYKTGTTPIFDPVLGVWLYNNPWTMTLSANANGCSTEMGEAFISDYAGAQQYLWEMLGDPNITVIKE